MRVAVGDAQIDLAALIAEVSAARLGAISTFLGTVRDVNDGKPVTSLEYSAYETMAVKELERIVAEGCERWPESDIVVVHRVGLLQIGEVAVAVVAGHPHRGPAFEVCRYVIDELKRRVPIWKREHYVDGTREWVDPTPIPASHANPK